MIEIKGAGFTNKGAELMLLTVVDMIRKEMPGEKITIAPVKGHCEYDDYSRLGLYPKLWYRYKGFQFGYLGRFIPASIRSMLGFVTDHEINTIIDVSGFEYSDQWGVRPTREMAIYCRRWKKAGKRIVLLPQAFGPFRDKKMQRYMKDIIDNVDLIYARDKVSYDTLKSISKSDKIRQSPDFTVLIKGVAPEGVDPEKHEICIIPNMRIVDKIEGCSRKDYVDFLHHIVEYVHTKGLSPFLLVHAGDEDNEIAQALRKRIDFDIPVIYEEDPLKIKGIIGQSKGLISSRFHGIANGFYQGVPTLGTGWSHKYKEFFGMYGFPEGLIGLDSDRKSIENKLDNILLPEKREVLQNRFRSRYNQHISESMKMMSDVMKVVKNE